MELKSTMLLFVSEKVNPTLIGWKETPLGISIPVDSQVSEKPAFHKHLIKIIEDKVKLK